jgi:fructose transport system substrate-binding protein
MFHKKNVLVAAMITIMVLGACVPAPAAAPAPAAPAATSAPAATTAPAATKAMAATAVMTATQAMAATAVMTATKAPAATQAMTATAVMTATQAATSGGKAGQISVGLITKTETNPFFVKMKEGAAKEAAAKGVKLLTAAGAYDGDNQGQVTAIENMVNAGVKGILITPNDSKAIVPTIQKARQAGVLVIALDTPLDPQNASDSLFATNNMTAGQLIGQYAKAVMAGKPAKIAMIDGTPGTTVSQLRHDGFLAGYGIKEGDAQIVCTQAANGDQAKSQTAMENCLSKAPAINLVYTINEPTAFGVNTALKAAGTAQNATVVSIDGGCTGVNGVKNGQIAATSQQYPLKMASMGVDAIVNYAQAGTKVSGYTDTGVTLLTDKPMAGVSSKDTTYGLANCWG